MIDISKLSSRYEIRYMQESDAGEILCFCLQNEQYYRYCGKQPTRELIQNDLSALPPGKTAEEKHYVGFYDGRQLVAIMDLIDGYPSDDCGFIGFFMMNKQLQGRQIGSFIIREVCDYLRRAGFRAVLLGIDKGNPQSTHFWKKNGFIVIRESHREDGTILVAEKIIQEEPSRVKRVILHGSDVMAGFTE